MPMKSEATWLSTRIWCLQNPTLMAAIVTPEGTYTVVFTPVAKTLFGVDHFEGEPDADANRV